MRIGVVVEGQGPAMTHQRWILGALFLLALVSMAVWYRLQPPARSIDTSRSAPVRTNAHARQLPVHQVARVPAGDVAVTADRNRKRNSASE
jgi:hypothetical protein